ncbi:g3244 [Coccomyxa elongata]
MGQQVLSNADGGEAHENGAAGSGADKDEGGGKAEEEAVGGAKDVKASVAGVVQALTELVSVQTPASVWLPNKHLTLQHSGKGSTTSVQTLEVGPARLTVSSRLFRHLRTLVALPGHAFTYMAFRAQQIMLSGTLTKLIWSIVVGLPLCAVGGVLYSWASGKSLVDGTINAYGALYKIPGVTVIGEVNALTSHLMNVLWLVGTFTFATVIGIITEDVTSTIMNVRSGNYGVVAANHTLILNWNDQTVPLLRQIALNRTERADDTYDGPVVVLAEREKEDMDRQLRRALRGTSMEWHTRSGAPHALGDLEKVAAGQARTIILMQPDSAQDAGKKQVAAILGVQSARAATQPRPFLRLARQHLAVQAPEAGTEAELFTAVQGIMEASAQSLRMTRLSGRRDMSTLLAQSAFSPGVASVYCSIVQQTRTGVECYVRSFPELQGMTFAEVRRRFDAAVVIGFMLKGGALRINPPEDLPLDEGARVIALAPNGYFQPAKPSGKANGKKKRSEEDRSPLSAAYKAVLEAQIVEGTEVPEARSGSMLDREDDDAAFDAKKVVVAWFGDDISDLVASLAAFAPRGSSVSVVSKERPKGFPEDSGLFAWVRLRWVEGDPSSLEALRSADLGAADSIVIGDSGEGPAKEADALTLTTIALAQEVLLKEGRDGGRPAHCVGMVRAPETVEVANFLIDRMGRGMLTAELLQPDELVAGIIAQVAAEPEMAALLSGFIYSSEGQEIFLRRPIHYALPDEDSVTFAQLSELLRKEDELAIGFITKDGHMKLAPRAAEKHKFDPNDRLIVISGSKFKSG